MVTMGADGAVRKVLSFPSVPYVEMAERAAQVRAREHPERLTRRGRQLFSWMVRDLIDEYVARLRREGKL